MTRRRGMTLLETLLAIVIASMIALLAYAAAGAGLHAGERVASLQASTQSEALLRALLVDAVRYVPAGGGPGDAVFTLDDATSPDGLPADAVTFRSRGITQPLGASLLWDVSLVPSAAGLRFSAIPLEGDGTPLRSTLSHIRGLAVRVIPPADSTWAERWSAPGMMPRAIELRFLGETGAELGTPLVARVGTEAWR